MCSGQIHKDTPHSFVFAGFTCIWAVVFLELWKREQNQLQVTLIGAQLIM